MAEPKDIDEATSWLGSQYDIYPQESGDLGERMAKAFKFVLELDFTQAFIIGTDCPDLNEEHLAQGISFLEKKDIVIGPANDGGYYLLGMKKWQPELFQGVSWSTSKVLEQTLAQAHSLGLSSSLLETLIDIDTKEDWELWQLRAWNS